MEAQAEAQRRPGSAGLHHKALKGRNPISREGMNPLFAFRLNYQLKGIGTLRNILVQVLSPILQQAVEAVAKQVVCL